MAAVRELIALACPECKQRNYTTTKNRKKGGEKLKKRKYCRCKRGHTLHEETKIK